MVTEPWAPKAEARVQLPKGIVRLSYCHEISLRNRLGHKVLLFKLPRLNFWARGEHLAIQLSHKHSFNTHTNLERIALTSLSHLLLPTRWLNCRFCNKSKIKKGGNVQPSLTSIWLFIILHGNINIFDAGKIAFNTKIGSTFVLTLSSSLSPGIEENFLEILLPLSRKF